MPASLRLWDSHLAFFFCGVWSKRRKKKKKKKACGNKWMNGCRAVTPPGEKSGRKDEKTIKATSEILKAVVEMSAGRAWPLKLRRLLNKEPGRKTSKRQNGEGRNAQNKIALTEEWTQRTERVSLGGFLWPSSQQPHSCGHFPLSAQH